MAVKHWPYGFYQYGGQAYSDKLSAMMAAANLNDHAPEIRLNFNDHVFGALDWQTEPTASIDQLYRERAQQLRDQYDYLVLFYSGGSDSRQVLHSFLDNDIFLDEVVTTHVDQLTRRLQPVADPNHPNATLFEHELTAVPGLQWVHKTNSRTKITVLDSSDELLHNFASDNYWADRTPISRLGHTYWTTLMNTGQQHVRKISEGHGRVAAIYGCDKPNVCIRDNGLYFFFIDTGFAGSQSQRSTNAVNFDAVSFFSSPDAPLIPIKQSHMLRRVINTIPSFYRAFTTSAHRVWNPKTRELTKHVIYPSWDTRVFQGNKLSHFNWNDLGDFLDHTDPRILQAQQSRQNSFNRQFGPISNLVSSHIFMIHSPSQHYYIGAVTAPTDRS